jgi:hypothetical protein
MKKIIFISFLSLVFLAAGAQRPSKVRTGEGNNENRKKSEITVNRSVNNKSRSYDDKTHMPINSRNSRTGTYDRGSDRSGSNRDMGSTLDKREYNQNNGNTNRSINDKIIRNRTDLHKNIRNNRSTATVDNPNVPSSNSGRGHSVNSRTYEKERKTYNTPYMKRIHREAINVNRPRSLDYRRIHYPYRMPVNINIYWTSRMYREYILIYPEYRYWYYPIGYRIRTASAYDAFYYVGDVINIYGRVHEVWYSWQTDEYFLYFGAQYPYHDFSVIIPGSKARRFSHRPEIFFEGRHIWVTGLVSLHDGKPEMIIRKKHQIHPY